VSRRGALFLLAAVCVLAGNAYLLRFRPRLRDLALYHAEVEDAVAHAPARPQPANQDAASTGRQLAGLVQACGLVQESAGAVRAARRGEVRLAWRVRGSYPQLLELLRRAAAELPEVCVERVEVETLGPGDLRAALEVAL